MKKVLFFRHIRRFSGGHLKIWDYYNHVRSTPDHVPYVRFAAGTVWDENNPWSRAEGTVRRRETVDPDAFFLGALDWVNLPPRQRRGSDVPVINLIQHVRHAESDDPRYDFLSHPAIRICVGKEVEDAIVATGRVNGPVATIPLGIDLRGLAAEGSVPREVDALVLANKSPQAGERIARGLDRPGRVVELVVRKVPRPELLDRFRRARVTVFLPHATEGFYMPALEGMALGTVVVCPDCVGNRSFCLPGANCFRPDYDEDEIVQAGEAALEAPASTTDRMLERASDTAAAHDIARERESFIAILERAYKTWERL